MFIAKNHGMPKRARSHDDGATKNAEATFEVVSNTSLCPPSMLLLDKSVRGSLHISCGAFTPEAQGVCVAAYSLMGSVAFPLLPLAQDGAPSFRRWCCSPLDEKQVFHETASSFGLLVFRPTSPPTCRSEDASLSLLPLALRPQPAPCVEIRLTERAFDAAWLGAGSWIVASVPCEERLVVVGGVKLHQLQNQSTVTHRYHAMPLGVVPLAVSALGSESTRLCVGSLHDGIFVFNASSDDTLELQQHLSPSGMRSAFSPAVRIIPFAVTEDLSHIGRHVPSEPLQAMCVAAVSPYEERIVVYHVVSARLMVLEVTDAAPLALSSAGGSLVLCKPLGQVDHITALQDGCLTLHRRSRFGGSAFAETPLVLSNPSLRSAENKSLFRRDIMIALGADGWIGVLGRHSATMSGWRWDLSRRLPELSDVGAAFTWLRHCGDPNADTHDVILLTRHGLLTLVRLTL